jgi:SAM-dependent methyltransferase
VSVASHLVIDLEEYDARIRTFIPYYDEMLDVAASIVARRGPRVLVDLGTGTGALAERIAADARGVSTVGIDADEGMLAMAAKRLPRRAAFVHDSFVRAPLPRCDAITASFALHHVESPHTKRRLFARARAALRAGGVLVSADCHPSSSRELATEGRQSWHRFLSGTYGPQKARAFLQAWAEEDFYTTLRAELQLLHAAGFDADVAWRRDSFAVIVAEPRRVTSRRRRSGRSRPAGDRREMP